MGVGALALAAPDAAAAQARQNPRTTQPTRPAQPARPAQPRPQTAAPAALGPVDELTVSKLLWSTMAAIDQANKTGNYSVLRDLGSPGFRTNNDPASLGVTFAVLRQRRIDLSNTLLVAPHHEFAPSIVQGGLLRMRGRFNLRPTAIGYDMLFQWQSGWRLHAVSVVPFDGARPPAPAARRN